MHNACHWYGKRRPLNTRRLSLVHSKQRPLNARCLSLVRQTASFKYTAPVAGTANNKGTITVRKLFLLVSVLSSFRIALFVSADGVPLSSQSIRYYLSGPNIPYPSWTNSPAKRGTKLQVVPIHTSLHVDASRVFQHVSNSVVQSVTEPPPVLVH